MQFQHAMAQAASQLQQIHKKHAAAAQQQLGKGGLRLISPPSNPPSSDGGVGAPLPPPPRSQPTKAQLTMPAALQQQAKFNSSQNSKSPLGIRTSSSGGGGGGAPQSPFSVCQLGVRCFHSLSFFFLRANSSSIPPSNGNVTVSLPWDPREQKHHRIMI